MKKGLMVSIVGLALVGATAFIIKKALDSNSCEAEAEDNMLQYSPTTKVGA